MDKQSRIKRFPLNFYLSATLTGLAVMFAILAFMARWYNKSIRDEYAIQTVKTTQLVQDIVKDEISKIYGSIDKIPVTDLQYIKLSGEIEGLKTELNKVDEQTLGLRQAINPVDPEDIITIARLRDSVTNLKNELDAFQKSYSEDFQDFKSSIVRELAASKQVTNYLFVVLVPLVLNMVYNFWKDNRSSLQGNKNTPKEKD